MADFHQHAPITTLHDLGSTRLEDFVRLLEKEVEACPLGLVLPVTASDMRADPFRQIVDELSRVKFLDTIVVALGVTQGVADYHECRDRIAPLGENARLLWTESDRVRTLFGKLDEEGLDLGQPGKGRSVWMAFGYLLADPTIQAFALHDCDIVDYSSEIVARLCLPMAHPGMDFEFCKAYYARYTDRMHGRVARLLVRPLIRALLLTIGEVDFLRYMDCFRYPLSGEFAVTATLAGYNRIPSDWGLEIGTLAEVFRNTSSKRVCQVDLCQQYEHKHQTLSVEDPSAGLLRMATDILMTFFRTLASMGHTFPPNYFTTLRSSYLRAAQDAIRQYDADSVMNHLHYDRHGEEAAVEGFASQIHSAGERFLADPVGGQAIPNWNRVRGVLPDFPRELRDAVAADAQEFGSTANPA